MCNTPTLEYQCGHDEPTYRIAWCASAEHNGKPCRQPQPKSFPQHGDCTICTVERKAAELKQSIRDTRQNCLRLGASTKEIANTKPTREQMRSYGIGKHNDHYTYDHDSGYGSQNTYRSGSQYSYSQSGASSQYSGGSSASRPSGSQPRGHGFGRQAVYAGKSGLRGGLRQPRALLPESLQWLRERERIQQQIWPLRGLQGRLCT